MKKFKKIFVIPILFTVLSLNLSVSANAHSNYHPDSLRPPINNHYYYKPVKKPHTHYYGSNNHNRYNGYNHAHSGKIIAGGIIGGLLGIMVGSTL